VSGACQATFSGRYGNGSQKKQFSIDKEKNMANCENFTITLKNSTHGEIKATKFEYKDGSKWKTENMFGIDGFKKIEQDHSIPFTRNLQGIGGESTQFRVTYKHHIGGTTWSTDKVETTETFTAYDNGSKTVTLTE
jgi:hypothetical protein